MVYSTLANWDGAQTRSAPHPYPTPTPSRSTTLDHPSQTGELDKSQPEASPTSSPRRPSHRSSEDDEANIQGMLLASDLSSSPVQRRDRRAAQLASVNAMHVAASPRQSRITKDLLKLASQGPPSMRMAPSGPARSDSPFEDLLELSKRGIPSAEMISGVPVMSNAPIKEPRLVLEKNGRTIDTAISIPSTPSVSEDEAQNYTASQLHTQPSLLEDDRELSVVPETPSSGRKASHVSPTSSQCLGFSAVVGESGSPEVPYIEDVEVQSQTESSDVEVIRGPERVARVGDSASFGDTLQTISPSKASAPRTSRLPRPRMTVVISSSPLTSPSSSEPSSPNVPLSRSTKVHLPSKPRQKRRRQQKAPPHQPYVEVSSLSRARRRGYVRIADVPFDQEERLRKFAAQNVAGPSGLEELPPTAVSLSSPTTPSLSPPSSQGARRAKLPNTSTLPTAEYDPLSPHSIFNRSEPQASSPLPPTTPSPLRERQHMQSTHPPPPPSVPTSSTPIPLELGQRGPVAAITTMDLSSRRRALFGLGVSSQEPESCVVAPDKPHPESSAEASRESSLDSGIISSRQPLFLEGYGDPGDDPVQAYSKGDPANLMEGKRLKRYRPIEDPDVKEAVLVSSLRYLLSRISVIPVLQKHQDETLVSPRVDKGKGRMVESAEPVGPTATVTTSTKPPMTPQRSAVTSASPSTSSVTQNDSLAPQGNGEVAGVPSPRRRDAEPDPSPPILPPPLPSLLRTINVHEHSLTFGPANRTLHSHHSDLPPPFPTYTSSHATHGLAHSYPAQPDPRLSDAMRATGNDPFLGPSAPADLLLMENNQDDQLPYTVSPQDGFARLPSEPQALWSLSEDPLSSYFTSDFSPPMDGVPGDPAYDPSAGTIDPSLLAGPSNIARMQSPPPSPSTYPELSQESRVGPIRIKLPKSRHTSNVGGTKGRGKGKGAASDGTTTGAKLKGKGKERASDVGIKSRVRHPSSAGDSLTAPVAAEGKRIRKPSKRALQSHASSQYLHDIGLAPRREVLSLGRARSLSEYGSSGEESSDDDNGDEDASPASRKGLHPVFEATNCHQCRRVNAYDKMRCTTIRANGTPCGQRYCERCIVNRYEGVITFDHRATSFVCPRCLDTCNCTSCSRGRGETYVPTQQVKHVEQSKYYIESYRKYMAKMERQRGIKAGKKRSRKESDADDKPPRPAKRKRSVPRHSPSLPPSPSPQQAIPLPRNRRQSTVQEPRPEPKPRPMTRRELGIEAEQQRILASMALPEGAVFGTVYGLDGTSRIGVAVVSDQPQKILLKATQDMSTVWASDTDTDDERFSNIPKAPSTPPPPARGGMFIGQPRKGWTARTPPPTSPLSPSLKGERSPEVVAFVGAFPTAQKRHEAVPFGQAKHIAVFLLSEDLTPEPEDEDEAQTETPEGGNPQAQRESTPAPKYTQEMITTALQNALAGKQNATPPVAPVEVLVQDGEQGSSQASVEASSPQSPAQIAADLLDRAVEDSSGMSEAMAGLSVES